LSQDFAIQFSSKFSDTSPTPTGEQTLQQQQQQQLLLLLLLQLLR
jgi:hypothetical protein